MALVTALVMIGQDAAADSAAGAPATPAPITAEGIAAYRQGDLVRALKAFKQGAADGDALAQYNLGVMYLRGDGVARDAKIAHRWHLSAAERGLAAAQHGIGVIYYQGDGVEKDIPAALSWFRAAAFQGLADAEYNLAVMYFNGEGVPKNPATAAGWLHRAARKGFADAQYRLASMLENGTGVTADREKAISWYRKAREGGHRQAKARLAQLVRGGPSLSENARIDTAASPALATPHGKGQPGDAWWAQLGALNSVTAAIREWERLRRTHAPTLDGLRHNIRPVTHGTPARTLYRLRAGPMPSRAHAAALCRKIRATGPSQGCFPARAALRK